MNERGEITTNTKDIQTIIRTYYEQLYANKFDNLERTYYEQPYANKSDNLEKMDAFVGTYKLPKLHQEEIESLNRPITSKEIETVIEKSPNKQKSRARQLPRGILPNI